MISNIQQFLAILQLFMYNIQASVICQFHDAVAFSHAYYYYYYYYYRL
jgi:hypothetical protein